MTTTFTKVENNANETIQKKCVKNLETNSCFENTYTESHIFVWGSGRYETRHLANSTEYTIRRGLIELSSKERDLIASQVNKLLVFCL